MKKWFKSPWGISITPTIISFLLTIGYDAIKGKPIFSTVWIILKAIWGAVLAFLNFDLKVWWVLSGIILLILIFCLIIALKQIKPDFNDYTEDTFQHWKWSWAWKFDNLESAWTISSLKAHCPKCNTPMMDYSNNYDGLRFACPRCNFSASKNDCDAPHKVELIILDNINRKRKEQDKQPLKHK